MVQGRLELAVAWDGQQVTEVAMVNSRPAAYRLLLNRTPDEALALVPRLFALCRQGQTVAAGLALAAARGQDIADDPRRAVVVAAEAAQEHLWRLLLDWPTWLNLAVDRVEFAHWHRLLAIVAARGDWGDEGGAFRDFVARELLGLPPESWLERARAGQVPGRLATLVHALRETGGNSRPAAWLPAGLEPMAYYQEFADAPQPDFARWPCWRGQAAETGPLARWRASAPVAGFLAAGGSRCAARVLARGVDLAHIALHAATGSDAHGRAAACAPTPGVGFAWVETARGLLVHRARLDQNRIVDYVIVAPTEWNFHPQGAVHSELIGSAATDANTLERRARSLVLALDPCVDYTLRVVPNGKIF